MSGIGGQGWPERILPPVPRGWDTWEQLMGQALREASLAGAGHEVPVGAVLAAPDGALLGRAGNAPVRRNDPTAHAEILVLREAASRIGNYRLEDTVLVVTLEPCIMCLGAIVHARVAGIVYGAADPAAGCLESRLEGTALPFLNHAPWHLGGIRQEECARLLRDFFGKRR